MNSSKRARPWPLRMITSVLLGLALLHGGVAAGLETPQTREPRLRPLEESEWNDAQKQVLNPLKPMFKDGRVINIFTTVARNPKLLENWNSFGMYIVGKSTLPARDRELVILRIGWLCKSEYEFGQHTLIGKKVGLTDDEILRITKGPDAPGWSDFEAALLRGTDELHREAYVSDATWKALSKQYGEQQLIDFIMTVGQYNLVSMALNSLRVQLDPGIPGFPEGANK